MATNLYPPETINLPTTGGQSRRTGTGAQAETLDPDTSDRARTRALGKGSSSDARKSRRRCAVDRQQQGDGSGWTWVLCGGEVQEKGDGARLMDGGGEGRADLGACVIDRGGMHPRRRAGRGFPAAASRRKGRRRCWWLIYRGMGKKSKTPFLEPGLKRRTCPPLRTA
jgi:hypothetical protein